MHTMRTIPARPPLLTPARAPVTALSLALVLAACSSSPEGTLDITDADGGARAGTDAPALPREDGGVFAPDAAPAPDGTTQQQADGAPQPDPDATAEDRQEPQTEAPWLERESRASELAKPGTITLSLLTADLLDLTRMDIKPPDPARLPAWDFVDSSGALQLPTPDRFTVRTVPGGAAIAIRDLGFERRARYAPLRTRDLRVESHLYLRLARPLADGEEIELLDPADHLALGGARITLRADPLRASPAVHVNQVGYAAQHPKKVRVGAYLGSFGELSLPAATPFKVIDARTGSELFSGTLSARMDPGWSMQPPPYRAVLEGDFSALRTPGEMRVLVPGLGTSLAFAIDDGVPAAFARAYALGLYHQRSGTTNELPFTRHEHDVCHAAPAEVPTSTHAYVRQFLTQRTSDWMANPRHTAPRLDRIEASLYPIVRRGRVDVAGGHHDAGDYSKYTINSALLIHHLVFAADAFAGVADLDGLGIPESGDQKSDILQEAKWEADFLAKMQDDDGGFFAYVLPRDRNYENDVLPDRGDTQCVYPKTTAVTAAAVAALAQIASSPRFRSEHPADAARYLEQARRGWTFLEAAIARYGRDGAYQKITHYGNAFMHDDELAWAAAELFLATGEATYHNDLLMHFDPASADTRQWGWWRLFESYGAATRSYAFGAVTGRLPAARLDATFLAKARAEVLAAGEDMRSRAASSAYGTSFPLESKAYGAAGWYFSSDQAFDIAAANALEPRPELIEALVSNLDYEGGANPVDVSYVTGLGWRRQREIVHQYALNDHRVLGPSGIPLGNIVAGDPFLDLYMRELGQVAFPSDGAQMGATPMYDRWSDTFNVSAEFVVVNLARALGAAASIAGAAPRDGWRPPRASFVGLPSVTRAGDLVEVRLSAPGLDLSRGRTVWEMRAEEPVIAPVLRVRPRLPGPHWIEAEAALLDGRRVHARGSFGVSASVAVSIEDFAPSPIDTDPAVIARFTFDTNLGDARSRLGALATSGSARLDRESFYWPRRQPTAGGAIYFGDLGDGATLTFPGDRIASAGTRRLSVEAMIYPRAYLGRFRGNVRLLALSRAWNAFLELGEDQYQGLTMRAGPNLNADLDVRRELTPERWHHVKMTIGTDAASLSIDGRTVATGAGAALDPWSQGPVELVLGGFDGWIDDVVIRSEGP